MHIWKVGLLVLVFLAACTPIQRVAIQTGVQAAMDANDGKARFLLQSLCAMGVGAKNRVLSLSERRHVEGLCGGEDKASIALEDLQALGDTMLRLGLKASP